MRKIGIIGANSNLARNFVYFLQKTKAKDIDIDLYDIQDESLDHLNNYHKIDYCSQDALNSINFDIDQLYIFFGLIGSEESIYSYNLFINVNEIYLLNLLNAIKNHSSKCKIIYMSSRLVYKDSNSPHKESDELGSSSIYSINKIAAEKYLQLYNKLYGIHFCIFRIAIPFGIINPNCCNYGIVSNFCNQAKENNKISIYSPFSGTRTFTHIHDICEILDSVPLLKESDDEIFNIGGHAYSMISLCKKISKKFNASIKFINWPNHICKNVDIKNGELDYTKLNKIYPIKYIDILNCNELN